MIKKLIIKIIAEVEKFEGKIKPQINNTGPKIGRKELFKDCNFALKCTRFLANKTNKATLASSEG